MFNVQVPLPDRGEVFLMNTFSDAQLLASADVADLLDRVNRGETQFTTDERDTLVSLTDNGFIVTSRDDERRALHEYFTAFREARDDMKVTVLTTLQCNFACDYCYQGDRDDYNKFASKMSLDTAARVVSWIASRLDEVRPLTGQDARFDAMVRHTETLVRKALEDEFLARPMTEAVARALQGAELLRYSTGEVVDVFLGTRCPAGAGAWGSHYGTLAITVTQPVARKIVQRAMVTD